MHRFGDIRLDNVGLDDTAGRRVGHIVHADTTNDLDGPGQLFSVTDSVEQETNGEKDCVRKEGPKTVFGDTLAFDGAIVVATNEEIDGPVTDVATSELADQGSDRSCEESETDVDVGEEPRGSREDLRADNRETDGPHEDDGIKDRREDDGYVDGHLERRKDLEKEAARLLPGVPGSANSTVGAALESSCSGKRRCGGAVLNRLRVLLVLVKCGRSIVGGCSDGLSVGIVTSFGNEEQDADPKCASEDEG